MPFAKRIVGEASQDEPSFGKSLNSTASTCEIFFQHEAQIFFGQLVSLVHQADDLFSELYTECSDLVERTRKVRDRVKTLTEVALRLNAKEVTVPEGNLSTPVYSAADHPHRTTYGYECQLFTPSNRPRCVDRLHQGCDVNPVHTIRHCNLFRIDGKTGSVIFSMNPTLSTSCTSFEVLQTHKTSIAQRTVKPLREPQCTAAAREDSLTASTKVTDDDGQSVPGDRIRILSQSQPILVIPVDVSGATYRQIHERRTRRSQSQGEGLGALTGGAPGKRSMRRRRGGSLSVSSIVIGSTSSERVDEDFGFGSRTCDDLWRQSPSKQRWERARLIAEQEESDSKPARRKLRQLKQRNKTRKQDESSFCLWRKSLCSMFRSSKEDENLNDLWIDGGPETTREPMIVDMVDPLPFTRSQSLPRSFRSVVRKPQSRLPGARSLTAVKSSSLEVSEPLLSPLRTLPSVFRMGKQTQSPERAPSNSSAGLNRSRSLRLSQRSRSLERGTMEVNTPEGSIVESPHPGVLETGALPSSVCREVIVHLPEQPWTKPFATVKLRPQSTKVEAEGCQTASGNWSVDSACHSMHSDQMTGLLLPSGDERSGRQARRSLDKDSAISDINQSDRLSTSSIHLAQLSRNHPESSCSESSSTTRSVSRNTRRKRPSSCVTRVAADDLWPHEDAMSLYSLDQDGFYTSMHADSGLSKSNHTLTPGDGVEILSDRTESVSSCEANAMNCEEEDEDEDSNTVIYDDWVPATTGMTPSQGDVLAKEESVSGDGEMAKDGFQVSKGAERCSETSLKPFRSNYNSKSVEFPSFCTITRNSSETDDLSFRGSLGSDASDNSLLATRLSFGSSQDQLETAGVSQTVGVETPIKSGDTVDFCLPSCEGNSENASEELNLKHGNPDIEPKQRRTSELALETEDSYESKVWLPSTAPSTLNSVKGILKSKKKKPFLHSKSINFGPITSLDEILIAKSTPLAIGSSDDVKSVTSYGVPAFSVSSFLGKDIHGVNRSKKKDLRNKESKAATKSSSTCENAGVLPLKYKPVIVVKPKQRVKDSDVAISNGNASNEVMTGYGCLGKDAISSCTGTVTVDERLASRELTPVKMDLAPVSAKLVITSPVVERTAYIENPHKRSLCTPLTPLDLQQYSGYNDPGSWYNTLPRKSSVRKKIAVPIGDGFASLIARLPDSDSLRPKKKKTLVERTLPSRQEKNSESLSSDEVGNTDCFAMNLAKCGTIKRASTLTRGVAAAPALPAAETVTNQDLLLNKSAPSAQIHTLRRSRQCAEVKHALLGCDFLVSHPEEGSLHSSNTPSNAVSRTSASPVIKNSSKYNNNIETCLLPESVQAKSLSSQTVEQLKAFDSISALSSHVTQDSRNQTIDQTKAFDKVPALPRFTNGEEDHVVKGELQNKHNALIRTFSSSSSDSSPDVVSSCDASLTILSTSFARSQESISSILSASEQNHIAKVTLLSSPSSDVQIDVSAASETFEPFSRHTIGKSNPTSTSLASANLKSTSLASVNFKSTSLASVNFKSTSLASANFKSTSLSSANFKSVSLAATNPETTDKDVDESQADSCDSNQTLEPSSRLMPPPCTSVMSGLAQSSAIQKQSFESDSSGMGSSISGSPTTSPDSDVAGPPSSTAFPGSSLSSCVGQSSASPDVIPLIARSECGSMGKRKMALTNQNARSKQTAV